MQVPVPDGVVVDVLVVVVVVIVPPGWIVVVVGDPNGGVEEVAEPQQTISPVARQFCWQHLAIFRLQSRRARRRHFRAFLVGHWDRRGSLSMQFGIASPHCTRHCRQTLFAPPAGTVPAARTPSDTIAARLRV
jgi:hypothetical protein